MDDAHLAAGIQLVAEQPLGGVVRAGRVMRGIYVGERAQRHLHRGLRVFARIGCGMAVGDAHGYPGPFGGAQGEYAQRVHM